MELRSNSLETTGRLPEGKPLLTRRSVNCESGTEKVSENAGVGTVLRCGRLQLWSVPGKYLFTPRAKCMTHVVTVHAEIFALAHEDRRLADILAKSVNTIDGRVLQGICKLLYPNHKIIRQNGSGFVFDLAGHCREHSEKLFLLGSSEKSNALAMRRLQSTFPGLQISRYSPPLQNYPFDREWNVRILDQVEQFKPHHLVVCFGPKKQEYWIEENSPHLTALGVRCAYGLGGTIDFVSGVKPRAPKWIEFIGAEWLFRLACEPRARFRRTLIMFKMPIYAARTMRDIGPLSDHAGE
jgi:N-acetylglucosaminyldiphosphoundecaprenol N-acetyl-beta-D-mannosaminyltransferase